MRWRDLWPPTWTTAAVDAVVEAYGRAPIERVEVACGGGVGRTGTALSLLAVDQRGPAFEDAVTWVRARYHPRAVQTPR